MTFNWLSLVHPVGGVAAIALAATAATYGWRYRNARLGKSGLDVMETFNLQKIHKKVGIGFLAISIGVWLLGWVTTVEFTLDDLLAGSPHNLVGLAVVILVITSATVILRFRRSSWASSVHLTLNGLVLLLLTVQLLSGLGLVNQLLP
ncbi:DUF4079 family protein [Cyanobacteria bacterium FACHB-472]|nr:DUF4079 family protein [Cyanobacteria bacterium FACHB-472]